MDELITHIYNIMKGLVSFVITGLVSAFLPIEDALFVLFTGFTINFITGFVTDIRINKKEFNMKKAFDAVLQIGYFFGLIFFISSTGTNLHDSVFTAVGVKWSTVIVTLYYILNVLKNGKQLWPGNIAISLLYDILSLQGVGYFIKLFGLKKEREVK